jgi:hypothetical protein
MDAFLRQRLSDRRFATPLQGRRSEAELYAGCLPQSASTGAHPLAQVRIEASAKKKHCWEGYERTPGTKAGTDGSCRPKGSKKKKKDKKAKKDGDASSSSSSDDDDEHHKKKKAKKD